MMTKIRKIRLTSHIGRRALRIIVKGSQKGHTTEHVLGKGEQRGVIIKA